MDKTGQERQQDKAWDHKTVNREWNQNLTCTSQQEMMHPSFHLGGAAADAGLTIPARKVVQPNHFPTALYKMLTEIHSNEGAATSATTGEEFVSIVSWQPHGKCFLIHDEEKFSNTVLPKYFCRLKYTSFQRQLHFYRFKRLSKQGAWQPSQS